MKKILTLLLSLIIVLGIVPSMTIAASINNVEDQINMIEKLGIYIEDDEMDYIEDYVTREHYAQILSYFVGNDRSTGVKEFKGVSDYSDVPEGRASAYEIMLMTSKGYLSGYTDGTFHPEDAITLSEAVKTMVAVLGYDQIAKMNGGWPNGYVTTATDLKLLDGITLNIGDSLTKGDLTKLLWNTLNAEVLKFNINTESANSEDTLMNELDYYEVKGRVNAVGELALYSIEPCRENEIVIGDECIETTEDYSDFIGQYVVAYYEKIDEETKVVKYINRIENKNDIIEINANDLSRETTVNNIVWDDGKKEQEERISNDASVIFNGRRIVDFTAEHLLPNTGKVTLVNADSKEGYETIIIKSYKDMLLNAVKRDGTEITMADGSGFIVFDTEEDFVMIKDSDGEELDASSLKQSLLVSVAADKVHFETEGKMVIDDSSSVYEIILSGKTERGKISSIDKEERIMKVGDRDLKFSKALDIDSLGLGTGKSILAYINAFDEMVAAKVLVVGDTVSYLNNNYELVSFTFTDDESYAFLIRAYIDEETETTGFKLFTEGGEVKTFTGNEKIKLNGVNEKDSDNIINHLKNSAAIYKTKTELENAGDFTGFEQLIKYTLNSEGKISSIKTMSADEENDETVKLAMLMKPGFEQSASTQGLHAFWGQGNIENIYSYENTMPVFFIPDNLENVDDYTVRIASAGGIPQNIDQLVAFDADEYNILKVIVMQTQVGDTIHGNQVMERSLLVDKVETTINEDDEIVQVVKGYLMHNGSYREVQISDNVKYSDNIVFDIAGMKRGDIFAWNEDASGNAAVVVKGYSPDGSGSFINSTQANVSYYSVYNCTGGTLKRFNDKYIVFEVTVEKDGEPVTWDCVLRRATLRNIMVVDSKSIRKGTLDDAQPADNFGNSASKVYMYTYHGALENIVIYNE